MRYKILIQEEESIDGPEQTYMSTILQLDSSDETVIAAALRAFADRLNPNKPVTRGI